MSFAALLTITLRHTNMSLSPQVLREKPTGRRMVEMLHYTAYPG